MSVDARPRTVFLVHGRDAKTKRAVEDLLRAFDLRVATWEMAAAAAGGGAPYTGDIVNAGMEMAHTVVVLMTPDDVAYLREELRDPHDGLHETRPTGQPRMNVLFEAGMAMARGRDRVVLVEVGTVRPMSDIAGVNTIRFDGSLDSRRRLGDRLRATGLPVDMDNDRWWSAGQFGAVTQAGATGTPPPADTTSSVRPTDDRGAFTRGRNLSFEERRRLDRSQGRQAGKAGAYEAFWRLFLDRVRERNPGLTRATTRNGHNWLVLASRKGSRYVVGFASGGRLRSELYIDRGDADLNAVTFGALLGYKDEIEAAYGGSLSWEELPERRASRIADYEPGDVLDEDKHIAYADWFIESAARLRTALDPLL